MSDVKVDFTISFQEFNIILECLENAKADIERKKNLANQELSARQDFFIRFINQILRELEKQAMQSSTYYEMPLIQGEMDNALEVSKSFMKAVKNANGAVWLSIKESD